MAWLCRSVKSLLMALLSLLVFGAMTLRISSERIPFTENTIHFHADGHIVPKVNLFFTCRDRMDSLIKRKKWLQK